MVRVRRTTAAGGLALALGAGGVLALLSGTGPFAASNRPGEGTAIASPSRGSTVLPLPESLRALGRASILVAGQRLSVVVADTEAERTAGLQGVTDLGSLDGMLFAFPSPTETRFWMKDTLIPLDIAFFDADGALVSARTMPLCTTDPCPTYDAGRPYVRALETPAGRLGELPRDARMAIEAGSP